MKLTWFGNSTFRLHLGGQIVVVDADFAPDGIERKELLGGADLVVELHGAHSLADAKAWRPRPRERLLDAGDAVRPVQVWSMGAGTLLLDPDEDVPLLILAGPLPELGRWAEKAVIVMTGADLAERCAAVLNGVRPRLLALAASLDQVDSAIAAIRDDLGETGLVALEPGMAVEV